GAEFVSATEDVWRQTDIILKIKEPVESEYPLIRKNQILFTYLHLATSRTLTETLLQQKIKTVAYETVEDDQHRLPLLAPMSEITNQIAPHVEARLQEKEYGGHGVLIGGVSGVRPAKVLVLGAGITKTNTT